MRSYVNVHRDEIESIFRGLRRDSDDADKCGTRHWVSLISLLGTQNIQGAGANYLPRNAHW